ncbi:hypothetical protein LLH06_10175 [Mucilaginibacter daejeonensis]|nr:hypothetical protein [Mucilaginibacter daejeonensis]UEG51338.1 hypothetical protein LLH06_10175 [Mucilaginibacter daejeonensis]
MNGLVRKISDLKGSKMRMPEMEAILEELFRTFIGDATCFCFRSLGAF